MKKRRHSPVVWILACLCLLPNSAFLQEISPETKETSSTEVSMDQKASANQVALEEEIAPKAPLEIIETDIGAFVLKGKRARHRLDILDLDVFIHHDGRRYFPLYRLLDAMKLERKKEDHFIVFTPQDSPDVTIDTKEKQVRINGETTTIDLIVAISDMSMAEEVFLPPEVVARIFSMDLVWDDDAYAFIATTQKTLEIWKQSKRKSLLSIETQELVEQLPQVHGPAKPEKRNLSLDFMRVETRAKYKAVDPNSSENLRINSLQQTLWGSLMKGRYKLKLSEPGFTIEDKRFDADEDPLVMVDWGEWRYATEQTEIVAGDSNFGLNGLIFPSVGMTGIRNNGILGLNEQTFERDASRFGLKTQFSSPLKLQGTAPVGAEVKLFVNDRLVDSDEITDSLPANPGTGIYRFENVYLPPGSLNNIRIEITETNGVVTVIEKSVAGTTALLPQGGFAYFTGAGTKRDTKEWDAHGLFGGARVYYGLNDRLTIGTTVAYQNDFFKPVESLSDPEDRQYPSYTCHAGTQVTWKPIDRWMLSGELAWVYGKEGHYPQNNNENLYPDDGDDFNDFSFKLDTSFFPTQTIDTHGLFFWYGPDYFNGNNKDLRDRTGYILNLGWHGFPKLDFKAAGGQIWDNVKNDKDITLSIDVQNIQIISHIIPKVKMAFLYDRLSPSWNESNKNLYTFELRWNALSDLTFTGEYSFGDDLDFDENNDFLDALILPGISLNGTRATSVSLKKRLPWKDSLELSYLQNGNSEETSIIYTGRNNRFLPLEYRGEIGYDISDEHYFFESRLETPLSQSKKTRAGFLGKYNKEEWEIEFYITINEIFSFLGGIPKHIRSKRIDPERKIFFGTVFLDKDADAIMDPGEEGIEDINVLFNHRKRIGTDEDGNFIISVSGQDKKALLNLDPDSIPANLSCTHGRQEIYGKKGEITRINFGLTPVNYVTGYVTCKGDEAAESSMSGIQVMVTAEGKSEIVAESITADDGSYYLEDIRPGTYNIILRKESVPLEFVPEVTSKTIKIQPADDSQDIELEHFILLPAEEN